MALALLQHLTRTAPVRPEIDRKSITDKIHTIPRTSVTERTTKTLHC